MAKRILTTDIFTINPENANEHANLLPVPNDRKRSPKRMAYLRGHLDANTFYTCNWAVATCLETGLYYRVNGKHSSILLSDLSAKYKDIQAFLTVWECDTLVELAQINALYDRPDSNRSDRDVYMGFAICVPTLEGAMKKTVTLCVQAIACAKYGKYFARQCDRDVRGEGIIGEDDFCKFARIILEPKQLVYPRAFRRYPVVTAMYKSFQVDPTAALRFWEAVTNASGKDLKAPDRKLHSHLITTKTSSVNKSNDQDRAEVIERDCLQQWRAWFREYKAAKRESAKAAKAAAAKQAKDIKKANKTQGTLGRFFCAAKKGV